MCPYCKKKYVTKGNMRIHQKKQHPVEYEAEMKVKLEEMTHRPQFMDNAEQTNKVIRW